MEDNQIKSNRIKELGKRVKEIRVSKNVSLRDLAKHIGLTRSFLSQVERGITTPSIASLEKLARALNTGLNYFFKEDFPANFSLFRKKRKKKFIIKGAKVSCEVLASDILDITMVPFLFTLDKKENISGEHLRIYRRERFIFIHRGKIELMCGRGG